MVPVRLLPREGHADGDSAGFGSDAEGHVTEADTPLSPLSKDRHLEDTGVSNSAR